MTPAEELTAAAEKLRALATAASTDSSGRPTAHWDVRYQPGVLPGAPPQRDRGCALIATDGGNDVRLLGGGSNGSRGSTPSIGPDHGRYAAAMDPGVGAALADWLDEVAERLAVTTHPDWQDTVEPHALAVARRILGTTGGTGRPGAAP